MKVLNWMLAVMLLCLPAVGMTQSTNVLSPEYVMQNLKKGVTKRADVLRLFGEPAHTDVQVSSETGSFETLIYGGSGQQSQMNKQAQSKALRKSKASGGFGAFLRTARGIANDVAGITGKGTSYGSELDQGLRKAENLANTADRLSNAAEANAAEANADANEPTAQALTLTIRLQNGVLTSYEMR